MMKRKNREVMKSLGFGIVLASLMVGCGLSSGEITCRSETPYTKIEAYIISDGGKLYLSDFENDLSAALELCQTGELPDSVGFNGIYSLDGVLIDECDKGQCVSLSAIRDPFCAPGYVVEATDVDFFNQWFISHIFVDNANTYPSCKENAINMDFKQGADTTFVSGDLGANLVTFGYSMLQDSAFIPVADSAFVISENFQSPYAKYIESQVINFFKNQDTVYFSITGNEMKITNKSGSYGIQFYNR